jgi:hypothetical protein
MGALQSENQKFCRSCGLDLEIISEVITDEFKKNEFKAVLNAKERYKNRKKRFQNTGVLVVMMSLLAVV